MPIARKTDSPFFWYDFRYRGVRYRGSTKETSKAAARGFEAQLVAKLELGDELPVKGRRAPLLRDFLPQFLASFVQNQLRAQKTKDYYANGARLLLNTVLSEFPIDRIPTSTVAAVPFPHSGSNATNAIRTLHRVLSHGLERGFLCVVPRFHLHEEKARELIYTPNQEAQMLALLPQPANDVFVICMDMGMRPKEVCRINLVDDVKWLENLLSVPDGKTKAAKREIGMSERVLEILKRRARENAAHPWKKDSPWAFTSSRRRKGLIRHITTVNKAFAKAKRDAGLPEDLVLYSARHTFGTEFMESTKDLKLTMKTMGHVDVKTAMRYQHPETGQVGDVINKRNAKRKSATAQNGHTFGHSTLALQ